MIHPPPKAEGLPDEPGRSTSRARPMAASSDFSASVTPGAAAAGAPQGLRRFAWGVLAYNLLVIAWGAFVRASGSGAGCGAHWPLCNGQGIPELKSNATIIEMTHRATSGIALLLVLALMVWTLRVVPRPHRARRASVLTMVFMLGEALIGAGLVLFELVAHDASMKRGLSMILHLGNTFLLLGALTITAWTLTVERERPTRRPTTSAPVRFALYASLASVLVLGSSGAIAALGDTLFPVKSLAAGLAQDLSPLAHVFLRLRMLHPFLAFAAGALVFGASSLVRAAAPTDRSGTLSRLVTLTFLVQFVIGLLNLSLLAPIPVQIVHLLMADATWIGLVLLGWDALHGTPAAARGLAAEVSEASARPARPIPPPPRDPRDPRASTDETGAAA
ncbi:MAG: Heme synthase, cytochrome oxidase biosis protein Cox15-CtaA [Labilithrix sp.]|nr:Heme synthase, cytochrome oxidase biosis protein Cox15-CtaA [Labilithrix sp.]